jgi:4-amino-4-deoxychorismate mutase
MNGLEPFRRRLDTLDEEITRLLGERFEVCREIALHKRAHGIPMMQPERVAEVRARYRARGEEHQLPSDFTAALFDLMIAATCRMEDELMESLSEEELLQSRTEGVLIESFEDDDLIEAPPADPQDAA